MAERLKSQKLLPSELLWLKMLLELLLYLVYPLRLKDSDFLQIITDSNLCDDLLVARKRPKD